MPNHIHLAAKLKDITKPLHAVLQSFKRFTARKSNIILSRTGQAFWHRENYDRVVREGKLGNAIWYILQNPVKAGFVKHWREWPGTYLSPDCVGFD
jgi:REP element-mobilizing transposase RayT